MLVHYFCHAGEQTGYGRAADDYVHAMQSAGIEVSVRPLNQATETTLRGDVAIYHGSPSQLAVIATHLRSGVAVKTIAMTTWETSYLPASFAMALNRYDAVLVPSRFCADVIDKSREAVAEDPITRSHVVPHCFDPGIWEPNERPAEGPFTFYSIGASGERKNMAGVLRAYLHAFDKADGVQLVLICNGADLDLFRAIIARSGLPPSSLPGLMIPDSALSSEEIVRVHQDADCFVSAARGEGWGLGMFEAAIMQRPVIHHRWGGQADFLAGGCLDQWLAYNFTLTPVFAGEGEYQVIGDAVIGKHKLPGGADARQLWAEPNLEMLARRMREAFENQIQRGRNYARFEDNREMFEDCYSTPVVGQRMMSVLKEIVSS